MRVRTLELRLIGLVLAGCWVVAAAEVLIGYRPGGPIDVAVGVAALVPAVDRARRRRLAARGARRPRLRGDGLARRRRRCSSSSRRSPTCPASSAAAAPRPSCRRSRRPIRGCSALIGTCLFTGFGIARRRLGAARDAPAPGLPGGAHRDAPCHGQRAWSSPPSRWATSSPCATGSRRRRGSARRTSTTTRRAATGRWGSARPPSSSSTSTGRSTGGRSGRSTSPASASVADVRWLAYVATNQRSRPARRGDDRRRLPGSAIRLAGWRRATPDEVGDDTVDLTAFKLALSPEARAAAESRGVSIIEGAPARQCRVAIDGPTFLAAFPQASWLIGAADLAHWRGQLDYWVFLDGADRADRGQRQRRGGGHRARCAPGDDPGRPERDGPRFRRRRDAAGAVTRARRCGRTATRSAAGAGRAAAPAAAAMMAAMDEDRGSRNATAWRG